MYVMTKGRFATLALTSSLGLSGTALGEDLIDLSFTPSIQTVDVGDPVLIGMVATPAGAAPQDFTAIAAILKWDPTVLQLEGFEVAPATWFIADFLNDTDGLNDDLLDGDALFTIFAPLGTEVTAPLAGLTFVTFEFTALRSISATELEILDVMGNWSNTEILKLGNVDVTGDITATGSVTVGGAVPCDGDLDGSGAIDISDLLILLAVWGTNPLGPPDFDGDGDVGINDFLMLLAGWGGCL